MSKEHPAIALFDVGIVYRGEKGKRFRALTLLQRGKVRKDCGCGGYGSQESSGEEMGPMKRSGRVSTVEGQW